ncbi:MAG TPA: helix-turn-helix domain-containing protein, partial [Terriglobales bacterium]|nr:helix-turn-helix domain-containing protein [Terriglobales bacterium]
ARVRWLPRHAMETALYADRDLLLLLVKFLGQRLREAQRREQSWMDRGVRERVIAALSRAARDASPVQAGAIRLSITHEELADRSAVSRPKLSLHLKALERTGVLRLGRGAVEIIDPERLDRERMNRPARAR